MNRVFLIKIIFSLAVLFVLTSCGYFTPKSANEYTVTKKSPLVIPPDMSMVPPSKKIKNKKFKEKKSSQENDNFNLEDILMGEVKVINKSTKEKNKNNNLNRKKLVNTILKMKESVILK